MTDQLNLSEDTLLFLAASIEEHVCQVVMDQGGDTADIAWVISALTSNLEDDE